jgi:hypothetical protein
VFAGRNEIELINLILINYRLFVILLNPGYPSFFLNWFQFGTNDTSLFIVIDNSSSFGGGGFCFSGSLTVVLGTRLAVLTGVRCGVATEPDTLLLVDGVTIGSPVFALDVRPFDSVFPELELFDAAASFGGVGVGVGGGGGAGGPHVFSLTVGTFVGAAATFGGVGVEAGAGGSPVFTLGVGPDAAVW